MVKKKAATTPVINITRVMTAELKKMRNKGFKGIRFHECYMSESKTKLKDFISDGLTEAQYEDNCVNYCTVVINPDFDGDDSQETGPYREIVDNSWQWFAELEAHLKSLLGADVKLSDRKPCAEYEISRVSYKWP